MQEFFGCKIDMARVGDDRPISAEESLRILRIMQPKASPVPLTRVGGSGDGAYLLPDDFSGMAACFSPGVNNRKPFEDELADRYGIKSHMADKSSDVEKFSTPLKPGLQTFRKAWLDVDGGKDSVSLDDWVTELCPGSDDLLLQMDIEGAEYRNILATSPATLARFRIIVLEVHGLKHLNHPQVLRQVLGPFLEKLDAHFICVHAHPNNCCGEARIDAAGVKIPVVHELTFLRRDRFERTDKEQRHAPMLPHPLDVICNVPGKPPLFLEPFWSGGSRSPEVQARITEAEASYARREEATRTLAVDLVFGAAQAALRRAMRPRIAAPREVPAVDLAAGKRFRTARPYTGHSAEGVVTRRQPFFFHTAIQELPWITIDLGAPCVLSELVIENRTDHCRERAAVLLFAVHDDPDAAKRELLPVLVGPDFLAQNPSPCRTPLLGETARYLSIWSPMKTALHFSSVQVLGWPAENETGST